MKRIMCACAVIWIAIATTASAQDVPQPAPDNSVPPQPQAQPPSKTLSPDDYKGWGQAGTGEDGLGNRIRSHIVRLDKDGNLNGRLALIETSTGMLTPVQQIRIRLIRRGDVRATTTPLADGTFTVSGLEPGVYSMVAAGRGGFLAWSVNIQPRLEDLATLPRDVRFAMLLQDAKKSLTIEAAAVPPQSFGPLKMLLRQYLPSEDSTVLVDPPEAPSQSEPPQGATDAATNLKHHQVRLTQDGRLIGRVRRMQPGSGRDLKIRQLNVFLLKNDQLVAQEPVSADGLFAFKDMQPGVYSLVGAGRDGFLAFSVDVLGALQDQATVPYESAAARSRAAGMTPVAYRPIQDGLQIDAGLAPPSDFNQQNVNQVTDGFLDDDGNPVADGTAPDAPPAGGGAGGGGGGLGGGGGGAGGGGGGLGGLLLGAAAGAGAAAAFDNGDSNNGQSSPSGFAR